MPRTRSIIPDDCWYFGAAIALAPVAAVAGGIAAAVRWRSR